MTSPTAATEPPRRASADRESGGGVGLLQRLAYLLVALAMHRAARQIRERNDALAKIPHGDDKALARYAATVAADRAAAETRLRTLTFTMPREDLALALTDALSWADSSPVARAALERLRTYYDRDYGLSIDESGRSVRIDPDYPAREIEAEIFDDATWRRQRSAVDSVTALIARTGMPDPAKRNLTETLAAWSGPHMDSRMLTPEAIARGRERLGQALAAAPLADHDRTEALFLVDYLTGDHTHPHAVDLLDTAPLTMPTTPAPVAGAPEPTPAYGDLTPPPPDPAAVAPAPEQASAGQPALAPGTSADSGPAGSGGSDGEPAPPDRPPPPPQDRHDPGAATGTGHDTGQPGPQPHSEPDPAEGGQATEPVDRAKVTQTLRDYLADVETLHTLAETLSQDRRTAITADMHTLTERLRTRRHELLAIAEHAPGLAAGERIQLRAVLYDIDAGKTTLPALMWMEDSSKRAADAHHHRTKGHAIAEDAVTTALHTLEATPAFTTLARYPELARLPAALRTPVDTMLAALRESGPVEQRREKYFAAAAELHEGLRRFQLDTATNTSIADFLQADLIDARYVAHPERAVRRLNSLLADTGVLLNGDQITRSSPEAIRASVRAVGTIIESVADGSQPRERLLDRYQNAMTTLGRQLVEVGADAPTLTAVRTNLDSHAANARAHSLTARDRRARWAERPASASTPTPRGTRRRTTGTDPASRGPTPRAQPYSSSQRRERLWQRHFRHNAAPETQRSRA